MWWCVVHSFAVTRFLFSLDLHFFKNTHTEERPLGADGRRVGEHPLALKRKFFPPYFPSGLLMGRVLLPGNRVRVHMLWCSVLSCNTSPLLAKLDRLRYSLGYPHGGPLVIASTAHILLVYGGGGGWVGKTPNQWGGL